jgi:Tfp pilus assembly protein PilF
MTVHNYLGITASQKGWQEAAEKELLEAISENPSYADAHFNLAVIYLTAQPPSREQPKKH